MTKQQAITMQQVVCKIDEARNRASKCLLKRDAEGARKAINDYNTWKSLYAALYK